MKNKILFVYINKFKDYPILYEYCTILQKRGNQVYYLGIGDHEEYYLDASGVTVYHADPKLVKSRYLLAKYFRNIAKNINPTLVHVFHFRWCFFLPVVFPSSKFVLDVRSVHVVNKSGKHSVLTPLKDRLTWLESLLYGNCIALTDEIKKVLSPSFKAIPIIPLGANTSKFKPSLDPAKKVAIRESKGLKKESIIMLYSGTINPIRRIDVLIEAFKELSDKAENVQLIIAGNDKDNPDTLLKLQSLTNELKIEDHVLFTGFLLYDDLINYYQAADIGLCYVPQVTYFDRQPPTKLFEYMAAGLLTISTRTTATEAIIENDVNGFLFNDSAKDFAAGMYTVISDSWKMREAFVQRAAVTLEKYEWHYIIDNHLCKYYTTLGIN